jgi:adenosylcobinamide-phosphate synthase
MNRLIVSRRLFGSAVGYLLDRRLGEPTTGIHPLVVFGRLMSVIERALYRDRRIAGVAYLASGVGVGFLGGGMIASTAGATYLSCGGQALVDTAGVVDQALARGDIVLARSEVRSLVGRDTDFLDEQEIARAVVESVAENTVDAVVAPLVYACLCGAKGALGYRAVNTLDALVGYRSEHYERFGWASARCDDLLNYLPARLTVLLVILARPLRFVEIIQTVCRDASDHPSPNAGVAEAAFAAALDICLGGENSYGGVAELRGVLGRGRLPERSDIARAQRLSRDVGELYVTGAVILALYTGIRIIKLKGATRFAS